MQELQQRVDDLAAQEKTFFDRLGNLKLQYATGTVSQVPANGWSSPSEYPTCIATGLSKVDLHGPEAQADVQVNDFDCSNGNGRNCFVWCAGSASIPFS